MMQRPVQDRSGTLCPIRLSPPLADSNVYLVNAASILAPNTCLEFDILTELLQSTCALPDPSISSEPRICVTQLLVVVSPPAVVGILTGGTGGCIV
ncbi:MAG: hypothetical protein R2787_04570 [Saprospiraceae bacterium]